MKKYWLLLKLGDGVFGSLLHSSVYFLIITLKSILLLKGDFIFLTFRSRQGNLL